MLASWRARVFFPLAGAEERQGRELPQPLVHAIRLQGGIRLLLVNRAWRAGFTRIFRRDCGLASQPSGALALPQDNLSARRHCTTIQAGRLPEEGSVRDWPLKVTRLVSQLSRVLAPSG